MFLKCSIKNSASAIFVALCRYEDEKENIPLFYLEIIGKEL